MSGYYEEKLSAERLQACYDVAPPRTVRYLEAEIAHIREQTADADRLLELGCGYGRLLLRLRRPGRRLIGIDRSDASLRLARRAAGGKDAPGLVRGDAARLPFADACFDAVVCAQNGISAFHVDPQALVAEAARVTRPGGRAIFSSYAPGFWDDRLAWFRAQSDAGLLGPIDEEATVEGVIVCRDGFRATTFGDAEFRSLAAPLGLAATIEEVDGSSLFCEFQIGEVRPRAARRGRLR